MSEVPMYGLPRASPVLAATLLHIRQGRLIRPQKQQHIYDVFVEGVYAYIV